MGQFLAQLLAQLVVQVHQRLVQQHQGRVLGQRAGQRHALLLATRKLGRQAVQKDVDVQALSELPHLGVDRGARQAAQLQRRGDVVGHRHRGVVDELLVDHGHVAFAHRHTGHVDAVHQHPAGAGHVQPGHEAHQAGLAGLGRAQQDRDRAGHRGQALGIEVDRWSDRFPHVFQRELHFRSRRRPVTRVGCFRFGDSIVRLCSFLFGIYP
ncbi:hypothetical protein D9M68_768820 [compost metagenome]